MENIDNWEEKFEVCNYAKKLLDIITHLNNIIKTSTVDIICRSQDLILQTP